MENYTFDLKEYRKKIVHRRTMPISIIALFIILLIGLAFFLIPKKYSTSKFYFVEINSFLNYSSASELSSEIQSRGGAGFIYYDGSYHVLACYYPTKSEAEAVVENLSTDYSARIYTLETKKFTKSNSFSKEENLAIEKMINKNIETINSLYASILKIDKGEISLSSFKVYMQDTISNYESSLKEFKNFQSLVNYSKYLNKISDSLNSTLSAIESNENYKLKYNLIDIVVNHSKFLSYLN